MAMSFCHDAAHADDALHRSAAQPTLGLEYDKATDLSTISWTPKSLAYNKIYSPPSMESSTNSTKDATPELLVREATISEAPTIHKLVNAAFNSDTTDQVFLTSTRVDIFPLSDTTNKIAAADTIVLIVSYASAPSTLVATCYIRHGTPKSAWLGTLCIDPAHQKQGLGRFLLANAEQYAARKWGVTQMEIDVVSTRTELMAWYERCDYVKTGNVKPFPYGGAPEGWLREGMEMVDLRKMLVTV